MKKYSQINSEFSTGDIILFHGPGPESELIEKIDHTPFSHVAIVVRLPEYEKPLLWTSDEITTIVDVLSNEEKKGVHLLDLAKVLEFCNNKPSKSGAVYTYSWRALNYDRPNDFMDKLEDFMKQMDGTAFPSLAQMAWHFFEGKVLGISANKKTMFCSELASDTFVHLDLLPKDTIINSLSPGSYAQGQGLKLLNGAKFEDEVPFIYD